MNLSENVIWQGPYKVKYIRTSASTKWQTVHNADNSIYIRTISGHKCHFLVFSVILAAKCTWNSLKIIYEMEFLPGQIYRPEIQHTSQSIRIKYSHELHTTTKNLKIITKKKLKKSTESLYPKTDDKWNKFRLQNQIHLILLSKLSLSWWQKILPLSQIPRLGFLTWIFSKSRQNLSLSKSILYW